MEPVPFLLVDDLEENLLSLDALLRQDDLLLLKARSGDEALELLLEHDVALALIDVQMPGLDGFELAELMRGNERTRRIPIIFVTAGAADTQRRFRGYEAGAVDFIQKPIEPGVLRSKVAVFFELYRQRQLLTAQRDELAAQAEALKEAARHKDVMLREINHRIKNLFSLTGGLISLSVRQAKSLPELDADLRARLHALAIAHELTLPDPATDSQGETATSVMSLLRALIAPHQHAQASHIEITGVDAPLKGSALTSLALLLYELITNAVKYGALSTSEGHLSIDLTIIEDQLHLKWVERGAPCREQGSEREGFGSTLEKAALRGLNGQLSKEWLPGGLSLHLEIPLSSFGG
ncbi:MAG: response regulator [Devosia sp.]|uniref:response regulator n=1 Tax=Devosia sp. TaxID=1871048 RepID=UPI003391328F